MIGFIKKHFRTNASLRAELETVSSLNSNQQNTIRDFFQFDSEMRRLCREQGLDSTGENLVLIERMRHHLKGHANAHASAASKLSSYQDATVKAMNEASALAASIKVLNECCAEAKNALVSGKHNDCLTVLQKIYGKSQANPAFSEVYHLVNAAVNRQIDVHTEGKRILNKVDVLMRDLDSIYAGAKTL